MTRLGELLHHARRRGAMALHIAAGEPIRLRTDERLDPLPEATEADLHAVESLLAEGLDDVQRHAYRRGQPISALFDAGAAGRYLASLGWSAAGAWGIFQALSQRVATLAELDLTPALAGAIALQRGLVLIAGPPDSGTGAALVALVQQLADAAPRHIEVLGRRGTVELRSRTSIVTVRETAAEGPSGEAIAAALGHDVDVIALDQLRSGDAIEPLLAALARGTLVIATLAAASVAAAIDRLVAALPPPQRDAALRRLVDGLEVACALRRAREVDGRWRRVAERLTVDDDVRALLRATPPAMMAETIDDVIASGRDGCQGLDAALAELVQAGTIAPAEARRHARDRQRFEGGAR